MPQHHLEWQDSKEPHEDIWKMANAYCKQLSLDGKNDWRLPTQEELVALAAEGDLKKRFHYLQKHVYWSTQSDPQEDLNAMAVYIGNGFVSSNDKCESNFIVCVRSQK